MGRGGAPAREISFVSLMAYGPKVFLLSLSHGGLQLLKPGRAVPNIKPPLKGKRFETIGEIQKNTMGQLMAIPTKDFPECFEQWKRHWENCVRSQRAYFEED